jgi:hypothetical protein
LQLLRLQEIPKPESLIKRGGLWLQLGQQQIHVGSEEFDRSKARAHIAYRVSDLSSWKEKLRNKNIDNINGLEISGFDRFEFRIPLETVSNLSNPFPD